MLLFLRSQSSWLPLGAFHLDRHIQQTLNASRLAAVARLTPSLQALRLRLSVPTNEEANLTEIARHTTCVRAYIDATDAPAARNEVKLRLKSRLTQR